ITNWPTACYPRRCRRSSKRRLRSQDDMLLVTSVCVSIKPYGPCPTLTVRLPPRELPPIDLALPHGGALFVPPRPRHKLFTLVRPHPRNKFCRWVEPFAPAVRH